MRSMIMAGAALVLVGAVFGASEAEAQWSESTRSYNCWVVDSNPNNAVHYRCNPTSTNGNITGAYNESVAGSYYNGTSYWGTGFYTGGIANNGNSQPRLEGYVRYYRAGTQRAAWSLTSTPISAYSWTTRYFTHDCPNGTTSHYSSSCSSCIYRDKVNQVAVNSNFSTGRFNIRCY